MYRSPRVDVRALMRAYEQLRRDAEALAQDRQRLAQRVELLTGQLDTARGQLEAIELQKARLAEERDAMAAERNRLADDLAAARQEPQPSAASDERYARLSADFDNYRKRQGEALERARASGRDAVLGDLADVADLLGMAIAAIPSEDADDPWVKGNVAVLQQLETAARKHGLRRVGEVGDAFDPHVHEAMATAPGPRDSVVVVHQAGWAYEDGKLLRPARVVVGDGTVPQTP